jgi:hypothetical protein
LNHESPKIGSRFGHPGVAFYSSPVGRLRLRGPLHVLQDHAEVEPRLRASGVDRDSAPCLTFGKLELIHRTKCLGTIGQPARTLLHYQVARGYQERDGRSQQAGRDGDAART